MTPKAIVNAYARRIQRGDITLDDVPTTVRDEVEKVLGA